MAVIDCTKTEVIHKSRKAVHVDLPQFAITQNAFLPEESMPRRLSDPYYEPWELLCDNLAQRINAGTIRDAIAKLPILSTDHLTSEAEWRRAYVMLAYLASANTWGGDKPLDVC